MRRRPKPKTITTRVEEFMREADDFLTIQMMSVALGEQTSNRVSAAVHHLRKYRVVDVVIQHDGIGWWYVRPEVEDQRLRKIAERNPEVRPRKLRRSRRPFNGGPQ